MEGVLGMLLSISDLKNWMLCPAYASYQLFSKRVPASRSTALELGVLAHKGVEVVLGGEDTLDSLLELSSEDTKAQWEKLKPTVMAWRPPVAWEILAVEKEVRVEVGHGITLVGRPDIVIRWNGLLWHVQIKTLARSVPIDVYAELIRTDWHEMFYQHAIEEKYGERVGGTILLIIRKTTQPQVIVQYLTRDPLLVESAMDDIVRTAHSIVDYRGSEFGPIKNRSACAGAFRNSLCPYKKVCDSMNENLLRGEEFEDAKPRYV